MRRRIERMEQTPQEPGVIASSPIAEQHAPKLERSLAVIEKDDAGRQVKAMSMENPVRLESGRHAVERRNRRPEAIGRLFDVAIGFVVEDKDAGRRRVGLPAPSRQRLRATRQIGAEIDQEAIQIGDKAGDRNAARETRGYQRGTR